MKYFSSASVIGYSDENTNQKQDKKGINVMVTMWLKFSVSKLSLKTTSWFVQINKQMWCDRPTQLHTVHPSFGIFQFSFTPYSAWGLFNCELSPIRWVWILENISSVAINNKTVVVYMAGVNGGGNDLQL